MCGKCKEWVNLGEILAIDTTLTIGTQQKMEPKKTLASIVFYNNQVI